MIVRSFSGKLKGFLLFTVILLQLISIIPMGSGGGPSRGNGLDISVEDITSHLDGEIVGLTEQTFSARISNSGTDPFMDDVNVTLTIFYPGNETENMSAVHSETIELGSSLSWEGNLTDVDFAPWLPDQDGYYLVQASANVFDDNPINDTRSILIRALSSQVEDVKVNFAPGSPSNLKIKRGENSKMAGYSAFIFRITNTGVVADEYNITIDSAWVMDGWTNRTDQIEPGNFTDVMVHVEVPVDVGPFAFDVLVLTATSVRNDSVYDSRSANVSVPSKEDVEVTVISQNPVVAYPGGEEVSFTYRIWNTGDFTSLYTITVSSRPSTWTVELPYSPGTGPVAPGSFLIRHATIKLPDLDLDTMDADRTEEGQTGALILTATTQSGVADSAEGIVDVGLVHTVDMEIEPRNITLPFTEESKVSPQTLNISVRVRSINNNKADPGADLDVNLTVPNGPNGVLFKPKWLGGFDENLSETWTAVGPVGAIKLRSGEWSLGQHVVVIAPPFPFEGRAVVAIQANPKLIEGRSGLTIIATDFVEINVQSYINYSIQAPRTEFFNNGSLNLNDDEDDNGIEDWREGAPGDKLILPFNITNYGNGYDRYIITGGAIPVQPAELLPDDWSISYPLSTQTVYPYRYDPALTTHSFLLAVEIRIPDGAPIGESATIKIGAASSVLFDPEDPVYKYAQIDIFVKQGFGVDLEPEDSRRSAEPEETVTYRLNVTNIGNGVDLIRFRIGSMDLEGWTVTFDIDEVNLTPNEKRTLTVRVTPSADAVRDEELVLLVRAQSARSVDAFDEVYINTTVNYRGGVELRLVESQSIIWKYPGEIASFLIEVANTGNGNDTIQMILETGNPNWEAYIDFGGDLSSGTSVEIKRGGFIRLRVNITSPSLDLIRSEEELYEMGIQALNRVSTYMTAFPRGYESINSRLNLTVGVYQEFKASITEKIGEQTYKKVLVGERTTFQLELENRGNGVDNLYAIPTSPGNNIRHLSWTQIDEGPFEMRPFQRMNLNLSVTPLVIDKPLFHEMVYLYVEAMAGDNLTYRRVNLTAEISMSRVLTESLDVDLGSMGEITVRICNMPDPGTSPQLDFPHQRDYMVKAVLDMSGSFGRGWTVTEPNASVTLTNYYELFDLKVSVVAPAELQTGSASALLNIDVVGVNIPGKIETYDSFLRAVYFDVSILKDRTVFENLFEGSRAKATITLNTIGNRGQETIPIVIRVDGEVVANIDAGPANPQDFKSGLQAGGGNQELVISFQFDLPRLKWYEKGKEMKLEVVIDPDDQINENIPLGSELSETNNMMENEFTIKNYVPPLAIWILSLVILVLAMIAGFLGYFFMKKRESWFLLPLSIGAAGGFGMMFFVPLEDAISITMANRIGLGIILIDLVFIIPIMIYFFTRAGDAYILHLINEKRRENEKIEGLEITKTIWKPIAISLIGGLGMIAIPMLFWVVPSEMDEGFFEVISVLVSFDSGLPVLILILIVPIIALALQMGLLIMKKGSLLKIRRTWDKLERLQQEIEEGFQ